MLPHSGGAVAIWSGSELIGRVVEHELRARLPGWRAVVCDPEEPLSRRIAGAATLTVVCSGERAPAWLTGPVAVCGIRVDEVPTALAVLAARADLVSVRDPLSRDRLRDADVAGDIEVIPHPGLLAHRVVDADSLPARCALLRRLGVLPDAGDYTVVTTAGLAPESGTVVVLPAELGLDDRLAILSGSRAVITTDEDVAALHAAGNPHLDKETALAAHFDRLAGLAGRALAAAGPDQSWAPDVLAAENEALRTAQQRRRQRAVLERQRLTEPNTRLLLDRRDALIELTKVRAENERLAARLADTERELREWRDTKLVRWTRPLRSAYARLRTR